MDLLCEDSETTSQSRDSSVEHGEIVTEAEQQQQPLDTTTTTTTTTTTSKNGKHDERNRNDSSSAVVAPLPKDDALLGQRHNNSNGCHPKPPAGEINSNAKRQVSGPSSSSSVTPSSSKRKELSTTLKMVHNNNNNISERSIITDTNSEEGCAFGRETAVGCSGHFPHAGSRLGPYFFLETIGAGTFASIHKCVNLGYHHNNHHDLTEKGGKTGESDNNNNKSSHNSLKHDTNNNNKNLPRVAVAKVELAEFESQLRLNEAAILDYLGRVMPPGSVPRYMGHHKSVPEHSKAASKKQQQQPGNNNKEPSIYSAIVMEHLSGEDMGVLRDKMTTGSRTRRLTVLDAVTLIADIMLPLLKEMHLAGVVHRDVKPSNFVRKSKVGKKFCVVDFGISKSFVEPEGSRLADLQHPWTQKKWLKPENCKGDKGYYRKERAKAEFRGTSMFASLRIHQELDYCPRDDIWSLMYVFCDLVSGGLPWMLHARADENKDRDACQMIKETVHGLGETSVSDETELLLMGEEYHTMKSRYDNEKERGEAMTVEIPEPLPMSKNETKVGCLRSAFAHLATLGFCDLPDYDLIQKCIRGFLEDLEKHSTAKAIHWQEDKAKDETSSADGTENSPAQTIDTVDTEMLQDTEIKVKRDPAYLSSRQWDSTLPIDLRFRIAQMQYNVRNTARVPHEVRLRDWMAVAHQLLDKPWEARQYEGEYRTSTDGLRRDNYLRCLTKCNAAAEGFGLFRSRSYYTTDGASRSKRRRRQLCGQIRGGESIDLVTVSRAVWGIKSAIAVESERPAAPPKRKSFGT